jgi:hypothetical protein
MPPALHIRGTAMIRALLVSAALFAIFAARGVPPSFPHATALASAISADTHHDQRPRFDDSGTQWSAPAAIFVPYPPSAESAHLTLALRFPSTLQTKGFHFNRPPPIS